MSMWLICLIVYIIYSVVTNFLENFFYMSWYKIWHLCYHGVSEGGTLFPPPKRPYVFLFLDNKPSNV